MADDSKKLGLIALTAVVISAMIGGGVFNLPQNMAQSAGPGAIIIAWVVTGVGMWFVANTFRILAEARPDATTGIYTYGELGFGKFTGFLMAWGYWLSNCFANIGYAVLLMDSLNYFFPGYFTGGNNLNSVIGGSIVIWIIYFIVMAGVKGATSLNTIGTIGKLLPIVIFLLIMAFVFKVSVFFTNFWGTETIVSLADKPLGSVMSQVKGTMLVTLWVFIGIEGAVVVSDRAKDQAEVGKATLLGFLGCLVMYIFLSLLPLGTLSQGDISTMAAPSTAEVLAHVVGTWGDWLMNIGVIISILSSWLVWTIMLSELPYAAAKAGTFPKAFAKSNKNDSPSFSLLVSSLFMQFTMIVVYFSNNAWNLMLSITGVMVLPCYIVCTTYLWKIATKNDNYPNNIFASRKTASLTGLLGTIYGLWLVYAAGLNYMLLAAVIYAVGIPFFMRARKESDPTNAEFTKDEKIFSVILFILGILGFIYLMMNYKTLLG
ncbi:basic amino acid/polyamine antiporter [uncultured Cetobacterium sp.]|uniref:basic amino acid/polyamine antiporter n=1 Tax=uncultured Cetobacterium sp. TaxID=527638 RepID=UPI002620F267|nr:basic amino acid/polyamine antiporter [uncultured Cetobacterium sp.]